jgi:hypothetical protein
VVRASRSVAHVAESVQRADLVAAGAVEADVVRAARDRRRGRRQPPQRRVRGPSGGASSRAAAIATRNAGASHSAEHCVGASVQRPGQHDCREGGDVAVRIGPEVVRQEHPADAASDDAARRIASKLICWPGRVASVEDPGPGWRRCRPGRAARSRIRDEVDVRPRDLPDERADVDRRSAGS